MVRFTEFRVYCGRKEGAGLFVYARVFATKREMLAALRAEDAVIGGSGFSRHTEGAMQTFAAVKIAKSGRARMKPAVGRVNLYKGALGTEVVIHEFAHAMFAWAGRKKLLGSLDTRSEHLTAEEQLCYVLGRMARRFVDRAYKSGLYA